MANATRFHEWLKTELAARGFHEWGGMSAFARQCGVHASVVSRALNGRAVPEIDVLRRFGHVLGRTLGEMLVAAGVAEPGELSVSPADGRARRLPAQRRFGDAAEQRVWEIDELDEAERLALIDVLRVLRKHGVGSATSDLAERPAR